MKWIFHGRLKESLEELLGKDEFNRFLGDMEQLPQQGDVIRGAGGFRKARYPIRRLRRGKRKGARVIYLFYQIKDSIYLADAYTHEQKDDLSADDIKKLKELSRRIKND